MCVCTVCVRAVVVVLIRCCASGGGGMDGNDECGSAMMRMGKDLSFWSGLSGAAVVLRSKKRVDAHK